MLALEPIHKASLRPTYCIEECFQVDAINEVIDFTINSYIG